MRKIEVRHLVLSILDPIQGALPEETLELFLNLRIRPKAEASEFKEAVDWLSGGGFIGSIQDGLDPDVRLWFIKEIGKVALRQ